MAKKVVCGICFVICGVLLLLSNLDIINISFALFRCWPIFLIGFGIGNIIDEKKFGVGSLLLILCGLVFLGYNFDIITISLWNIVIPVIIIVIGLSIIFGSNQSKIDNNVKLDSNARDVKVLFGGSMLDLSEPIKNEDITVIVDVNFGGLEIRLPKSWKVDHSNTRCTFGSVNDNGTNGNGKTLKIVGNVTFGSVDVKRVKED